MHLFQRLRKGYLELPARTGYEDERPLVIIPGWGETLLGWYAAAKAFHVLSGIRVVVICHPGWRYLFSEREPHDRLAVNVTRIMIKLKITGAIGYGHSQGGPVLCKASRMDPGLFSWHILDRPAGFQAYSPIGIALKVAAKAGVSLWHAPKLRLVRPNLTALLDGFTYLPRNPWALREASQSAAALPVSYLPRQDILTIRFGEGDVLYPPDRQVVQQLQVITDSGPHDPQYDAQTFAQDLLKLLDPATHP